MIIENTEKKPFKELSLEERKYITSLFVEWRQEELERYGRGWNQMNEWIEMDGWCGLVEGQVYRTKVIQATLGIPWVMLEDKWEFAAMDADGTVWVYTNEPTSYCKDHEWFGTGKRLTGFIKLSNLPAPHLWNYTLTKRPVVEETASGSILSKGEEEAIKEGIYGWNRDSFLEWVGAGSDDICHREEITEKLEDMNAPTNIQEYFKSHSMCLWYPYEVRNALDAFCK